MAGKTDAKTSRCWPGYEPVPSKGEHEEGSCRRKPASKNGGKEVDRERSRKKKIAEGGERGKQAKAKSPNASERRSVSKTHTRTKSAGAKKTASAPKKTAKKSAGTKSKAASSGKKSAASK